MSYKSILLFLVLICTSAFYCSDEYHPTLEDFCSIAPLEWECEIIKDNFNTNDIPQNMDLPIAIIKYKIQDRGFIGYSNKKITPSLTLDFYPIAKKNELISFIKSQRMYSWCIPIYYGETKDFVIITSPCFNNFKHLSDEVNASINNLQNGLKKLMIQK